MTKRGQKSIKYTNIVCMIIYWNILGLANGSKWSFWMSSLVFQPCATPCNPIQALWADLCGQKAIFSLFWPHFGPSKATFRTFWVLQKAPTVLSKCSYCFSNLVPPFRFRSVACHLTKLLISRSSFVSCSFIYQGVPSKNTLFLSINHSFNWVLINAAATN